MGRCGPVDLSASLLVQPPSLPVVPSHTTPALSYDTLGSTMSSRAVRGSDFVTVVVVELFVDMAARWGKREKRGMNVCRLPNQTRATSGARKREDPCRQLAISAML